MDLNAGEDKTLSRVLTGSGALTKTGTGTLTLSGTNTYSAGTVVSEGTLEFKSTPPSTGAIRALVGAKVKNSTGAPITVNRQTVADGETF